MSGKASGQHTTLSPLLILFAFILAATGPVAAAPPSEISTARRATQAAFDTYRESGMAGLMASVEACFERAGKLRKLSAVQYCYTLDASAAGIDESFAKSVGFPQDEDFSEEARYKRLQALMKRLSVSPKRLKHLVVGWEKLLGQALVETVEQLEKEARHADAQEREEALAREELAGPPVNAVKPLALGLAYDKRFQAIFDAIDAGELDSIDAYAISFASLVDASAYANSPAAGLKSISTSAASQLEKTWTWGVTNMESSAKTQTHDTMMYLANVTGAPVEALVLDVANTGCAEAATASHAFFVVRRADGRSLQPGTHAVLNVTLHQPVYMFGTSSPKQWCTTIVGAARGVDMPEASQLHDLDMAFSRKTLKLPGNTGFMNVVFAAGAITKGTADRLEQFIRQAGVSRPLRVVFNSTGGQTAEAMRMGALIRSRGWSTDVGRLAPASSGKRYLPGGCYSACALAYAGGFFRYLERGSELGVHRFRMDAGQTPDEAVEQAQEMGSSLVRYTKLMGIDPEFLARMSETSSSDISILTDTELRDTNILTGSWHGQTWGVEPDGTRLVLKGKVADELARYSVDIRCRRPEGDVTLSARAVFTTSGHVQRLGLQPLGLSLIIDGAVHDIDEESYTVQQDPTLNVINMGWRVSGDPARLLMSARNRFGLLVKDAKDVRTAWFAIAMKDQGKLLKSWLTDCSAR